MALTASRTGDVVTVTVAGAGFVLLDDHYIDHVEWDNTTTSGHQFVINDANGFIFLGGRCNSQTVGSNISYTVQRICKGGVQVPTMDSGTLRLFLAKLPKNM